MSQKPFFEPLDARQLFSGVLINSFGTGGVLDVPSGAVVVPFGTKGGFFLQQGSLILDSHATLTRYSPDGTVDTRFSPLTISKGESFLPTSDGGVYVLGSDSATQVFVHYSSAGQLDRHFANNGTLAVGEKTYIGNVDAMVVEADDSLAFAAYDAISPGTVTYLLHIPEHGAKTPSIAEADETYPRDLEQSTDGDLFLIDENGVTAFKPDLRVDTSFGSKGTFADANDRFTTVYSDSDGGLTIYSDTSVDSDSDVPDTFVTLLRLTAKGRLDNTFGERGTQSILNGNGKVAFEDNGDLIAGDLAPSLIEPDRSILFAATYTMITPNDNIADDDNEYLPVVQEIDAAGNYRSNSFQHGANGRLLSPAGQPVDRSNYNFDTVPTITSAGHGNIFVEFNVRNLVNGTWAYQTVVEKLTGT